MNYWVEEKKKRIAYAIWFYDDVPTFRRVENIMCNIRLFFLSDIGKTMSYVEKIMSDII